MKYYLFDLYFALFFVFLCSLGHILFLILVPVWICFIPSVFPVLPSCVSFPRMSPFRSLPFSISYNSHILFYFHSHVSLLFPFLSFLVFNFTSSCLYIACFFSGTVAFLCLALGAFVYIMACSLSAYLPLSVQFCLAFWTL